MYRRIERVGRSKLIKMNLTEPDIEIFMNLTHVTKIGSSHEKFDVWPRSKVSWLLFMLLQLFFILRYYSL